MNGASPRRITVRAPAKLNLGLEVLGRRTDGYHDLATIFLAVDLCDELTLQPAQALQVQCSDARLETSDNLVLQALEALRDASGEQHGALVTLQKRIPAAAGLGGASSDAAAALRAARELWRLPINDAALLDIAGRLGSDVPFFLRGGCALGRGRGDLLEPLPLPLNTWFVVVVPAVTIPHKTSSLYAKLCSDDYGSGGDVAAQAAALRAGLPLDASRLGNAFARALYAMIPELATLPDAMRSAGAPAVALSGAGPAHYAPLGDLTDANRLASRLRARLGNAASVFVVAPRTDGPSGQTAIM